LIRGLSITRLTYNLENEPFDVSGTVSDLENYKYDLKIDGKVDLEKITKIYPIAGMSLKGLITSEVESHGQLYDIEAGHYEKIRVKRQSNWSADLARKVPELFIPVY